MSLRETIAQLETEAFGTGSVLPPSQMVDWDKARTAEHLYEITQLRTPMSRVTDTVGHMGWGMQMHFGQCPCGPRAQELADEQASYDAYIDTLEEEIA